ncbi:MAG: PAS domain S-box protein [Ignavibacteriaceae bacterium]
MRTETIPFMNETSENNSTFGVNELFYRNLFQKNPTPMWVYEVSTLKFLMVNDAAVYNYGYSLDEFLSMTLKDIRPDEDVPMLLDNISKSDSTIQDSGIWRHKKKNDEIILVKISSNGLNYNGYNARFVMALEVTDKVIAKQTLISEVAKFKSIIESTSDLIFSVDKDYCYTSFNSAQKIQFSKLFNVDIQIGDLFFDPLNDEEKIRSKSNFDQALNGETFRKIVTTSADVPYKYYFDVVHNPIKNETGEIIGVSVFAKDITEQKFNYEKVKQLSQAIEQSPVTIVITDTNGTIEYINKKGADITGYSIQELKGKNPRVLSSGEKQRVEYQQLWDTIKSGNEWKGEFHNRKKTGELYWESATISPIFNDSDEIIKFLAIKEDITERKSAEAELIAAKEKAEEINRIKSAFLSNMSHELRTPLVGILGFADILTSTIEDDEQKTMASSILNSGKRLLNTLSSLLSLTELESIKENIELDEVDVNFICEDVFNNLKTHSMNKNVKFNSSICSESLPIKINNRLFRESIIQIIKNAETYTEHGFILLSTYKKAMPLSGATYGVIEIADTGIGIPADKLKVVFDEFRQVSEGIGRNFEGTGLGLTLTKKYVELMGGKIELRSQEDRGTRISLIFPLSNVSCAENTFRDINKKTNKDNLIKYNQRNEVQVKNILIVEDEDINRLFLEKCVSKIANYKAVSNGNDAIAATANENFDLILMDINLGNKSIDGLATVGEIRKNLFYKKTPIVAMTAYIDPEEIDQFLQNGFSHYIAKPFLANELKNFIHNIFSYN